MRPALQKLLSRPSSLELQRCLLDAPNKSHIYSARCTRQLTQMRTNVNTAPVARKVEDSDEELHTTAIEPRTHFNFRARRPLARSASNVLDRNDIYGEWGREASDWSIEELDFQSDLSQVGPHKSILLDDKYRDDVTLWAFLLKYRREKFGLGGVRMFWDAIRSRNIQLPTDGALANQIWTTFLSLGYEDSAILQQLVTYANDLHRISSTRWVRLHTEIVQHYLLKGSGNEALMWHHQLITRHPPGPMAFRKMCRRVILQRGSLSSLKDIYKSGPYRSIYSKVVPALISSEHPNLEAAVKWHFFFVSHGDLPRSVEEVEPLINYLRSFDVPLAINLVKGLAHAGVPIVPHLEQTVAASRETINSIYGRKFNIHPREYSDKLGARWLATRWVPLDVAIGIIHTLGLQEIGPLSLQAIALREFDPRAINDRIKCLKDLGISIGTSLFSRAIEHFAWTRDSQNLESLLTSDQHPDELENSDLQENLMAFFAERGDWVQYRRTLAVQSLRHVAPFLERQNLILRVHARRGDVQGVQECLSLMQETRTFVTGRSIALVLRCILQPRRRGGKPDSIKEMDFAISIMKQIVRSGSYVPAKTWTEILRRLGMHGCFSRLQTLSDYLVEHYTLPSASVKSLQRFPALAHANLVTPPPFHPLRIIFSTSFQRAVVEWGFIHALKRKRRPHPPHQLSLVDYAAQSPLFGVEFLKDLHMKGVPIDLAAVKKTLKHRLTTYYGPGRSVKVHNRILAQLLLSNRGVDEDIRNLVNQADRAHGVRGIRDLGERSRGTDVVSTAAEDLIGGGSVGKNK